MFVDYAPLWCVNTIGPKATLVKVLQVWSGLVFLRQKNLIRFLTSSVDRFGTKQKALSWAPQHSAQRHNV
jgi:hypothetical protein